jgi:CheY-like chemotaxis protein
MPDRTAPMKTILLVEDDPLVIGVFRSVLQSKGYAILEATSPEQALKWRGSSQRIDLIIADVVLPLRSGIHVAFELKKSIPDLRIILTSGYPADMWPDLALLREIPSDAIRVLQKPFLSKELWEKTEELIGIPNSTASQCATWVG